MFLKDKNPSLENIRNAAEKILSLFENYNLDVELLIRKIESKITTRTPIYFIMEDKEFHPWIGEKRNSIEWKFWTRYNRFLSEIRVRSPSIIEKVDEITDDVLDHLVYPKESIGSWIKKGLVVGQVQAGKTQNYIGLICKAADVGFKLIIVLAGSHNN